MLGTAWPSMRATFGVPVGALGLVLLLGTAGSVLVTVFVGTLIQRLGVPALLAVAGLCAAVGVTGYALAPGFGLVLGVSVLSGASAGMMDAGLNTAIALTGRRHERVLPVHRPRGRRRAVGGELLPRAPEPVHGRDGPGHVRLLGRADRRADLPGPRAPPGPAPHRGALRHRPGGDRGGGHLVAARPGRYRDRLRGPRRRPGRGLPGPDHLDPGAHRGAASPARHRLAGGRRRGRRRRSLRPDRPAHRRHQPGRPRPGADHPRRAGRRLRADPGPPRSSPGSPQPRPRSRPRSRGPQAVRRVRPGTASARSRTAVPTARSTGPRH